MASLFDINSLPDPLTEKLHSDAAKISQKEIKTSKAEETALGVIGKLEMGKDIHFVSADGWSCIDLLNVILDQTGPAEVTIATWSAYEDSIRSLVRSCEKGRITKLSTIFDWRIRVRTPAVYEFLKFNICNICLSNCHAKTTVIENDKFRIVIVGSANYTSNSRIETGVICCSAEVADFHKGWMMEELKHAGHLGSKRKKR
jgi:hypothetical protein